MVYVDTDFFVALTKEEDWLQKNALELYEEHRGSIQTSLPTFIELCFLAQDYDWELEKVVTNILEIAKIDFDEKVVYQAVEYIDQGLNVLDSFQLAKSEGEIISSDKEFDETGVNRIKLESS
ncbi:MAG: type II toxin-antitoxin system VapC family toxin [Candidatus Nanohalobium sp.]